MFDNYKKISYISIKVKMFMLKEETENLINAFFEEINKIRRSIDVIFKINNDKKNIFANILKMNLINKNHR